MGDIAIPNVDYTYDFKDPLLEEVAKYKQEVLEGLQIEEEGLTDLVRKKTKQLSGVSRSYNDPIDSASRAEKSHKNGQLLKGNFSRYKFSRNETISKDKKSSNISENLAERLNRVQSNSREINGEPVGSSVSRIKLRHQRHAEKIFNRRFVSQLSER